MTFDELVTALGQAVAAIWGELPTEVQHDLFEAAVGSAGQAAREELAIFLHQRYPRTSDDQEPVREGPEPDSLGG